MPLAELEEEGLVVDPGADEVDLVVGRADPAGQHLAGALHAVAQPHERAARPGADRPAVGRHRVDVVEQQRVRSQIVHIVAQVEQHRDRAQRSGLQKNAVKWMGVPFREPPSTRKDELNKRYRSRPRGLLLVLHVVSILVHLDQVIQPGVIQGLDVGIPLLVDIFLAVDKAGE